ncbi:MAG: T9SS type A sorting domain-containing protein [Bacteroidales bacterium]
MKRFSEILLLMLFPATGLLGQANGEQGTAADPVGSLYSSTTSLCLGDSALGTLNLYYGNPPYTVEISNNDGVYATLVDVSNGQTLWLKPTENDRFFISHLEDKTGKAGTVIGDVNIVVYPTTPVTILMDPTVYVKSDAPVTLLSNPAGSVSTPVTFYGPGVSGNTFYPSVVNPASSPFTIRANYTNAYGCTTQDEVSVTVLFGDPDVGVYQGDDPVTTICNDAIDYELRGTNSDGESGVFQVVEAGTSLPLDGYIVDDDPDDNLAVFQPAGLTGSYDILYSYSKAGLDPEASVRVSVNSLGPLYIDGFPDVVCSNDEPILLLPGGPDDSEATYSFAGPGVSGSQAGGYSFDPGAVGTAGEIQIAMTYTSSNGCVATVDTTFVNNGVPVLAFSFSPACIPESGSVVQFANESTGKNLVDEWLWNFGDPGSGAGNVSNLEEPSHMYASAGSRLLRLEATTGAGCTASLELDTVLSDMPRVDFAVFHSCYVEGESIPMVNRTQPEYGVLENLVWTVLDKEGTELDAWNSTNPAAPFVYEFQEMDTFQVRLEVENDQGCRAESTQSIVLRPTVKLTSFGYIQNFNSTADAWTAHAGGDGLSWTLGEPDFNGFTAVSGDHAWFTDLPKVDDYLERSWVESPCFNFEEAGAAQLRFDLMKSFYPGVEGVVFQADRGQGNGWETVGMVGEGIQWYNVEDVYHEPGGSQNAWSNTYPFSPDYEWVRAIHHLDMVSGKPHVKFRFVLASGGTSNLGNQGFAFDNFEIFEQSKIYLLEHFTNSGSVASVSADHLVDSLSMKRSAGLVTLQYHTAYPGSDPMNAHYPYGPETRSLYYGVPSIPYAVLNGGIVPAHRFTFSDEEHSPGDESLNLASEEEPAFDIEMNVNWRSTGLDLSIQVVCLTDTFDSNLQLYVALIEKEITSYTGANQDTLFRNVVLEMKPGPGGSLLGNDWYTGKSVPVTFTWSYPAYVEDLEELAVVAFVQDREGGGVLQAAVSHEDPDVSAPGTGESMPGMTVYPNPVRDVFHVNLGPEAADRGQLRLLDISGKQLKTMDVSGGYQVVRMDVRDVPPGLYVVTWSEDGRVKAREKVIRLR